MAQLLDGTTTVVTCHGSIETPTSRRPVIEVDRLNVRYGDFHAVKDSSFHAERGELYALGSVDWLGRLGVPGLFDSRRLELVPNGDGTPLTHTRHVTGVLVPFLKSASTPT